MKDSYSFHDSSQIPRFLRCLFRWTCSEEPEQLTAPSATCRQLCSEQALGAAGEPALLLTEHSRGWELDKFLPSDSLSLLGIPALKLCPPGQDSQSCLEIWNSFFLTIYPSFSFFHNSHSGTVDESPLCLFPVSEAEFKEINISQRMFCTSFMASKSSLDKFSNFKIYATKKSSSIVYPS